MIDSVPLIQNANDAQQINASIIAMKKASRELDEKIVKLNSLNSELDKKIALLDSGLNKEIEDRKEAINSLDVPGVGGSGKYISAISETDGKISATASDITSTVSSGNSQPVTSGGVYNLTSINTNTSKTDANLCYSDSTRVEFFRLPTNASNCPPSNNTNPTYIEAFTYNDGNYLRVTQMAYDNYNGVASYIRSGYSDGNNITWSDWQPLTPINGVTSGNLQPVTSNAVASVLESYKIKNNITSVAISPRTSYTITLGKNNSYRNVKGVFVGNAGSQLPFSIFVGGYDNVMSVPEIAYLASSMSLTYDRYNYTLTFTFTGNKIYSLKYIEINTEQFLQ
jgi:hypothetical protein